MGAQGRPASSLLGSEARLQDRHGGGHRAEHRGIYMICWIQGSSSIVDKDSQSERLGALQVVRRVPSHGWPPPSRTCCTSPPFPCSKQPESIANVTASHELCSLILCQASCSMSTAWTLNGAREPSRRMAWVAGDQTSPSMASQLANH